MALHSPPFSQNLEMLGDIHNPSGVQQTKLLLDTVHAVVEKQGASCGYDNLAVVQFSAWAGEYPSLRSACYPRNGRGPFRLASLDPQSSDQP